MTYQSFGPGFEETQTTSWGLCLPGLRFRHESYHSPRQELEDLAESSTSEVVGPMNALTRWKTTTTAPEYPCRSTLKEAGRDERTRQARWQGAFRSVVCMHNEIGIPARVQILDRSVVSHSFSQSSLSNVVNQSPAELRLTARPGAP